MGTERRTYLLGGRRVTVKDLIEGNLLAPGDTLTFDRPRVGKSHIAVVDARGGLLVGGRAFATPSGAACTAARLDHVDGWMAWVTRDGRTLHELRSLLLDNIAADAEAEAGGPAGAEQVDRRLRFDDEADSDDTDADESAETLLPRHVFLKEARSAAEQGSPLIVPVRALLARWGGRARGQRISRRIQADLENHGLLTRPNFMRVSLDDVVALAMVEPEAVDDAAVTAAPSPEMSSRSLDSQPATSNAEAAEALEIGLTLGNLTTPEHQLVSINPNSTFAEAMTLMLMNDYSQLPMLADEQTCDGVVTWKSMAYAQLKDANAPLAAAVVPAVVRSYDHDLHSLLPTLKQEQFILVRDTNDRISGIVTTADVVGLYGDRTLPFLLIGELDQELRQIMAGIPFETVLAVCSKVGQKPKTYDDMTMYQYVIVLEDPDCWSILGWPLDRQALVSQLHALRKIRNDVMHFNPDGVPGGTVDRLRHMLGLIREFGPVGVG